MKKFVNQFFATGVIFLLLLSHAYSHHSSKMSKSEKISPDLTREVVQIRYCTKSVKLQNKKEKAKSKNKVSETEEESKKNDSKELDYSIDNTWIIKNYHDTEPKILGSIILVKPIKGKPSTQWGFSAESKLIDIVKAHCIINSEKGGSTTYDREILNKIRDFNGLKSGTSKIGEQLFENGIKVPDDLGPLVYFTPDYLIKETRKEKADKEAKRKNDAAKAEENKWLSDNRPRILEKAEKFKQDQDDKIGDLFAKLKDLKKEYVSLKKNYAEISKSLKRMEKARLIQNMSDPKVKSLYLDLLDKEDQHLSDTSKIDNLDMIIKKTQKKIESLKSTSNYQGVLNLIESIKGSSSKKSLQNNEKQIEVLNSINYSPIDENLQKTKKDIQEFSNIISEIDELKNEIISLDESIGSGINYTTVAIVIIGILLSFGIGFYVYSQNRKISSLSSATDSAGRKFSELEGQLKSTSERLQSVASSSRSSNDQSKSPAKATQKPQTPEEIIASKFDELLSDYKDAVDDFSKVVPFKQKWSGLALSRKERQDGTKTILINSSRAFEKSEIWCLNFDNKFFAFPGSTVKSNMAAYMNLDFEKAQRDFKGVFSITSGSSYLAEPSVLRRGGAGFVVERPGKLTFPQ